MVTITKMVPTTVEVSRSQLREDLIQQIIKFGPQHFDMSSWFARREDVDDYDEPVTGELWEAEDYCLNECGTTACLAGHAAHLMVRTYGTPSSEVGNSDQISALFGIERDWRDADPFSSDYAVWPEIMRNAYRVSREIGDDEGTAQWRAALAYLISLRGQDD